MSAATRHCYRCGWEYTLTTQPARTESCHRCGSDLRICMNCIHYDLKVAYQCRERRADPVQDKITANFCEYFEMARRTFAGTNEDPREKAARENLKKLLGD